MYCRSTCARNESISGETSFFTRFAVSGSSSWAEATWALAVSTRADDLEVCGTDCKHYDVARILHAECGCLFIVFTRFSGSRSTNCCDKPTRAS